MVGVELVKVNGGSFRGKYLYQVGNHVWIQFRLDFDSKEDATLFKHHMVRPADHVSKLFTLAVMEDCKHGLEKLIESLKDMS